MDVGFGIWFVLLVGAIPLQIWAASHPMRRAVVQSTAERHRLLSSRSVSRIIAGCAATLTLVVISTACAGEAAGIAARGGLLVGHAYRSGVSAEQLRPSTQLVQELIAVCCGRWQRTGRVGAGFRREPLVSLRAESRG
jgi:hypothetical protein